MNEGFTIAKITDSDLAAYFSAEIGLYSNLPTFEGGLGVLSGDSVKAAGDIGLPMIVFSLMYRRRFRQEISQGKQLEHFPVFNPEEDPRLTLLPTAITVPIENRSVKVQIWKTEYQGRTSTIPIHFLDTDVEGNEPFDRNITQKLYLSPIPGDKHKYYRLAQEIVLGIGGMRAIEALGYKPTVHHMNEGHGVFAALESLKRIGIDKTRAQFVFTTHTPVPDGHDWFDYTLANQVLGCSNNGEGCYLPSNITDLAGPDRLNNTLLALNLSRYANGVSKMHAEVSQRMFPDHTIHPITNGVHTGTWMSDNIKELMDRELPGWRTNISRLHDAGDISLSDIAEAHYKDTAALMYAVKQATGTALDPELVTLGSARRFATYKRGAMLVSDLERLASLSDRPFNVIFGGKAHPHNTPGKAIIKQICDAIPVVAGKANIVFLENYDMRWGKLLTAGATTWLNTPRRPMEASGTSGMKANANARPNVSIYDGWWCEANGGGWTIGPKSGPVNDAEDKQALYDVLRRSVLPVEISRELLERGRIGLVDHPNFSAEKMMGNYADVYFPD